MADNVAVTPGTGATFATDDIGGIQYPRVKISQGADGSGTDVSSAAPLNVTLANGTVPSHAVTNAGTFAVQVTSAPSTAVTNAGTFATQVSSIAAGTNNIGDVDVLTLGGQTPAYGSGANGSTVLRVGLATDSPGVIATGTAGTASSTVLTTQGIASMTPLTTQLSEGGNIVSGAITTAMTGTTSTSLVAAPGASLRNYITTIIVSNSHATVGTDVIIQDGSGGTTLMTIPAAAVYGGAVITLPVPLRQPTTNTALFCANVTTGASTKVSAVGYKGA